MGYRNVNNFIVIQADGRNPDTSWRNHRSRNPPSLGGVDCVAPIGTPIYAPAKCVLRNIPNNGSGGNTIEMTFPDGWVDEMMHFSRFTSEGSKEEGALVGFSGDSGAPGQPHVHWFRRGGWYNDQWGSTNRYNPWNYFTAGTAGGSGSALPQEDDKMYPIIWNGHVCTIGPEQVKHETNMPRATFVRNVVAANDKFINLANEELTAILESFGVPWYAFDATIKGKAYNIDGTPGKGHFWSRQMEILNAVKGITFDKTGINNTIKESIAAGVKGVAVAADLSDAEFARIAREVNDVAANRLKS